MELTLQDYPSLLPSLQPTVAVRLLNARLGTINKLNADLADWLQERRRIEEQYAQSLRKLAARQLLQNGGDLGILTTPWQKIVSSIDALANSHHTLANNLGTDVENPLRTFAAGSREMQALSTICGNLQSIAKDVDSAQKKAGKLQGKGGKASAGKVANAASDVETAHGEWESQAPYVFERLQEVDEIRMDQLRNLLTQYQTHVIEATSEPSSSAEECLNALLNMQTIDEIKTFVAKVTSGAYQVDTSDLHFARADTSASLGASNMSPVASTSQNEEGGLSRSGSSQEKSKGGLSGLKRLGTVIGRRRQSVHPYGQPAIPENKTSSSNLTPSFAPFKKKSKELHPRPVSSDSRRLSASTSHSANQVADPGPPASLERTPSTRLNQVSMEIPDQGPPISSVNRDVNGDGASSSLLSHSIPSGTLFAGNGVEQPVEEPVFSVPAQTVDPITQAERDAVASSDASQQQLKVDIRNAPIAEEDGDANAAMANVANTLRAQAAPRRTVGTVRGRRDRNTMLLTTPPEQILGNTVGEPAPTASVPDTVAPSSSLSPIVGQTSSLSQIPQSPLKSSHKSPIAQDDVAGSDTHSIRSGRSLSSTSSSVIRHPDMHEPGLNSSIVETVSAWFTDGALKRALVVGEVALAYNPVDFSAPFGTDLIRLDNFPALEKVAPNPAFIEAVPGQPGAFNVTLRDVTKTAVAFKYQMHLAESAFASHTPLFMKTSWKIESTQASVVLAYGISPGFAQSLAPQVQSVALQNVVIILHMDPSGAKATACKAMSGGVFSRERNLVYWRLGDVTLGREAPATTLRARFFTEGEGKGGNVEARWEMSSDHLVDVGTGISVSVLEQGTAAEADPFADEDAAPVATSSKWHGTHSVKRFRSGVYQAS